MLNTTRIHKTPHLIRDIKDHLQNLQINGKIACVCDTNTYSAVAEAIEKRMASAVNLINLGLQVNPKLSKAEKLAETISSYDAVLCIGSGTLTDLCKYACFKANKHLISLPTAASMNGYLSETASLMDAQGHKQSLAAKAPDDVLLDPYIYAQAPLRMQQAGLGDTLCRSSVQMDALLSHLITNSWYDALYFNELMDIERELIAHAAKFNRHDIALCELLMQALLLSGEAMKKAKSSAPASQGEHMIAHQLELRFPTLMKQYLHGAHIACSTLTMLRLQAFIISKPCQVDKSAYETAWLQAEKKGATSLAKREQMQQVSANRYQEIWEALAETHHATTHEMDDVEAALLHAQLPTSPEALGLLRDEYAHIVKTSFATRDRITFLDLAAMR